MNRAFIVAIVGLLWPSLIAAQSQAEAPTGKTTRVTFATDDNLVIAADFTPPTLSQGSKAPVAILLHMYRSNREAYRPLIPHLTRAGIAALTIDLRGHGESPGPLEARLQERVEQRDTKLFAEMRRDVDAAYAWLAENQSETVDLSRFLLVGASVGCSIALEYASRDRSVDGVVCLTAGTNYLGLDSVRAVRRYGKRPLLLVTSDPEKPASVELGRYAPQATLFILPGKPPEPMSWHGTKMFGAVEGVEKRIVDFLIEAAGKPSDNQVAASINSDVFHPATGSGTVRISPKNLRWFSSAEEAEARGLHAAKGRQKQTQTASQKESAPPAEAQKRPLPPNRKKEGP